VVRLTFRTAPGFALPGVCRPSCLAAMFSDLRFAVRQLLKSPAFAITAVASLALGIGANTAVFSVMNAVLLAELPVKNPHELVLFNWLAEENVGPPSSSGWQQREPNTNKMTSTSFSVATFEAMRANPGALAEVWAFAPMSGVTFDVDGSAEIISGAQVASGNYHSGLGVTTAAGRLLTPADDNASAEPVAVLSYAFWQRRFGGDPTTVGKVVAINGTPVTIVGVTAPSFSGTMQVGEVIHLTFPLAHWTRLSRATFDARDPGFWWVRIMGRLQPGATFEQARSSVEGAYRESARGHVRQGVVPGSPAIDPAQVAIPLLRAVPGSQGLYEARRNYEKSLHLLMGVVGLVLLVACANVANLLLARGAARRREIAVRLALGASRPRLVRQLLAESVLLAGLGAVVGLLFAWWGAKALVAMSPFGANQLQLDTALDWRVLGFASAAALVTGVTFGLAPALRATKLNLTTEFQGGARTLGAGSRGVLAKSLMIVQVALSLVLLIGAGLFIRTLRNLQNVDIGYNREQLLIFQANAGATGLPAPQVLAFYQRLRERVGALPGVQHASFSRIVPLGQSNWTSSVHVPGYVQTTISNSVQMNGLGPDYLATFGLALLRGRDFAGRDDDPAAPKVAIVNQAFAKKYFGHEDVIGRRVGLGRASAAPDIEIVGLIRDAQYADVRSAPRPQMFIPYGQMSAPNRGAAVYVVRYSGTEAAITAAVRSVVRELDPTLPLTNVRTVAAQIDRLFTQERLFANLCSVFGALALALSAVGLYGLMSYAVVRRTGEIGLRMALGAMPAQVLRMVLGESFALVVIGIVFGCFAAWGATRWTSSLLFGLSPTDPVAYAGGAVVLLAVALAACMLPARRASRVEPMRALRTE
jgi:predicted permease